MYSIEFIPQYEGKSTVELLPIHFGQILTYSDDYVIRSIIKQRGAFDELQILGVTNILKECYDFTPYLFVDIGANIGTHSIFSLTSGMYKRAVAIEPVPRNFQLLIMNAILNRVYDKMLFSPKALSNTTGFAELELSPNNFGDNRVVTNNFDDGIFQEQDWSRTKVQTDILDNLKGMTFNKADTLVWIDVQGHEGHLFEGGENKFKNENSPYIVCEFYPYGLKRAGGLEKFFNFLETRSKIINIANPEWQNTNLTVDVLRELANNTSQMDWHLDLLLIP